MDSRTIEASACQKQFVVGTQYLHFKWLENRELNCGLPPLISELCQLKLITKIILCLIRVVLSLVQSLMKFLKIRHKLLCRVNLILLYWYCNFVFANAEKMNLTNLRKLLSLPDDNKNIIKGRTNLNVWSKLKTLFSRFKLVQWISLVVLCILSFRLKTKNFH